MHVKPIPSTPKETLEQAARELWEEAHAADRWRTEENTKAVLGDKVSANGIFVWSRLTVAELRALRRAVYATVLEARG
jgi:hypothetical protein